MAMMVQLLGTFLSIKATRGGMFPHTGYVETILHIPRISGYDKCILLYLVICNRKYANRVPIQVDTSVTGEVINLMTPRNVQKADEAWRKVYHSLIMAHTSRVVEDKEFSALLQSKVTTMKALKVPLLGTAEVKGTTKIIGNSKQMYLIAEPLTEGFSGSVVTTQYIYLGQTGF